MKILDRYIIQTFVVSLVIVLVAMMGIALVLDLFFNMNQFIEMTGDAQELGFGQVLWNILDYYFYKAFDYFQLLLAPVMLVSAAASLVRLNRGHEITGMKAAGVSLYRIMWPMVAACVLLDVFYIVNQEFLIPAVSVQLTREPDDLVVPERFAVDFVRDEHNNIIYAPVYDPVRHEMLAEKRVLAGGQVVFPARIRIFERDSKYRPRGTIEAERAVWNGRDGWNLEGGVKFPPMREGAEVDHTDEAGVPCLFYHTRIGPEAIERYRSSDFFRYLSSGELKALAEDPMRGNRRQLQVTLHQHVTSPILNLLILLLGLPFVAGREDRNYFASIGIAIALFVGVFVLVFASTAFGNSGHVSPLLAAWVPVFAALPAAVLAMESLRT